MISWNVDRFEIPQDLLLRLRRAYQDFDNELIKIESWYLANPRKRKKNIHRFIVNWMNKTKPKTVSRNYKAQTDEFIKMMKRSEEEACEPPDEWAKMKLKLKGGFK